MNNSRISFKLLEIHGKPPVGHTEITCHLVIGIKLYMTIKARYVEGCHITDVPTHMTYSSAVSCDTLRIGFLMDAISGLDILAGDIHNFFL